MAAAVSTLAGLWLVCPDIAYSWRQTVLALTTFGHQYVAGVRTQEIGFDHSLFALVKLLMTILGAQSSAARPGVYLLTVALGGILLFLLRIRHLPVPNQVLCLSVAAILLPPLSYDYTLLHLYAGLVLLSFVAIQQEATRKTGVPQKRIPGLWAAFLILAFLLPPQSELIWHGDRYAGQVKALALLALGYVSLRYPFVLSGLFGEDGALHPLPMHKPAPPVAVIS